MPSFTEFLSVARVIAWPIVGLAAIIVAVSNITAYGMRHGFKANTMILAKDIIVGIAIIAFCMLAFAIGPK